MAAYDQIAEWYENTFLADQQTGSGDDVADPLGIRQALELLLGDGSGACLDIGCGTGIFAAQIREIGWQPVGVDLSTRMLGFAKKRLPVVQANAAALPVRSLSVQAAVAVMVHTDMPDYASVIGEAARVLRPGGHFVHIGVHPCFCGGFADRRDPEAIVLRPGYADRHWTTASWTDRGLRDKVGATHIPLPQLLRAFVDNGLHLENFTEGTGSLPTVFAVRAQKHFRPPT